MYFSKKEQMETKGFTISSQSEKSKSLENIDSGIYFKI